jgi:tetratricopeptide (TPR) repeat protein/tRNA A-37 threonylcarbamoyl transferase component Bud32
MAAAAADRNLLFGILALQMDFISRDALIRAMNAWVLAKATPLGQILVDQGGLSPANRELLEALVQRHLEMHDGEPERSLAALSSVGSLRHDLERVADSDLQISLAQVAKARQTEEDPGTTQSLGPEPPPPSPGRRYRILRPHARGGLGEVFVARDEELHREVALKEIQQRHANHPESRARFLREAEITGGLEHPGIVPVYGLGHYADGRPFYAMRLIKGDNLQEAIKRFHEADQPGRHPGERRLAFRQLLGRFVDVCDALAYAHSRGVLHRDLKPGNIMLGKFGETLVVDWGLAKPTGNADAASDSDSLPVRPNLAIGITLTQPGAALGTPAFMSPEQAAGKLDQLGTASDMYSLGATLYALLTGQPPFTGRDVSEVLAKVERGDFRPPRQVKPATPTALEAVCVKAMALQPADRYSSARALAADIEHWLADEPVSAWREPWGTRFRRWARRHRPLVAGAAVLLVTTSLALAAGLVLVTQEKNRTQKALDAEQAARDEALRTKNIAQTRDAETQAVLDFVENKIFAAGRPKGLEGGLGKDVLLRDAVNAALPFVSTAFPAQPLIEARLRMTLGVSFLDLGDANAALKQYQAAQALFTTHLGPDQLETIRSTRGIASSYYDLGRYADAQKLNEEALARLEDNFGPDHLDKLAILNNLANCLSALGRHAEALKLQEETLALRKARLGPDDPDTLLSMNNLANSYAALRRHAEALALRKETLALRKAKLGPEHPDTLQSMGNLARSYEALRRHAEALKLNEETLALRIATLGPDHADTLRNQVNLANNLDDLGRYGEAVKWNEKTLALMKTKLGVTHPYTLVCMNNLAEGYTKVGRHAEALQLHQETLKFMKAKLGPDHPNTLMSMANVAEGLVNVGRGAEAVRFIDEFVPKAAKNEAVDPALIASLMDLRLRHFEKNKDGKGCAQTAEMWEKLNRADMVSLYQAARFRAVTAAVIRAAGEAPDVVKRSASQADQAMAWLQKAIAAGYPDAVRIKKDKDLDPLHSRKDFKQLLAEVEAKAKPARQ